MFLHRRKLRILIFWSAYALQYKYSRNVGLKERFEAIGGCQSLPEGLRMSTKSSLSLTVYHNRGARDVDVDIYGTSFRSLESSGDKPLHILTILFLGSINHALSWERSVHCDVIRPRIVWIHCLCVK